MDGSQLTELVRKELSDFKKMSTEEYILWQKWEEVGINYPMEDSILLGEPAYLNANDARIIQQVKNLLWDGNYQDIQPELLWIGDPVNESIRDHWTALRILIHSQQHSGAIGRSLNYLVRDKPTKKYLGVISIASDFLDLAARDNEIGWTRHQRTQEQRIQHTAVCSTIVPVQPFGYNYLGGKLLALLCISNQVANDWEKQYDSKLVALTTTSLFGKDKGGHGLSQYDNLKFWKKMGYSTGSSALRVSKPTRALMYEYAKETWPDKYDSFMNPNIDVRDRLNRFHQWIYRALGLKANEFTSNHDRGVYFARRYINTDAFLRNEISQDDLISRSTPHQDFTISGLTTLWKERYAKGRFEKLALNSSLKTEPLFYDDLALLSWESAKEKYLPNVGR